MPKQAPVSLLMLVTSSLYLWVLSLRALGPVCLSAFINMTYSGWSIFSPCLLSELHSASSSSILSSMRPVVSAATGSSAVVTVCPFPGVDHLFVHQLPQLIYGKAGVEFKSWFPSLHLFHQPVPCSPQEWLLDRVIGDNAWHTAGARYTLWWMSDQTGSPPISSPIFCVFLGPSGLLPPPAKVCFWTNCWGSSQRWSSSRKTGYWASCQEAWLVRSENENVSDEQHFWWLCVGVLLHQHTEEVLSIRGQKMDFAP